MSLIQVNQSCGSTAEGHPNVNGGKQCFEGVVRKIVKWKRGFQLTALTEALYRAAIKAKNIVIFPDIESVENDNTEPEIKEGRFYNTVTKEGANGNKFVMELATCTHDQVSAFDSSILYQDQAEVTDKGELIAQLHDDGKVEGLAVQSFLVGKRNRPITGENPTTDISVKYGENTLSVLKPDFDIEAIEGIQNMRLEVVGTPTAAEIVVKATSGCGNDPVNGLALTDFTYTGGTLSGVEEVDGTYTFTGTGLVSGTLGTIVADISDDYFEALDLAVTI